MKQIMVNLSEIASKVKIDPPPVGAPSLNIGLNRVFFWAGVIAVIVIVIAGFRYITSAGSPDKAKQARNTIVYTVIGLLIILFSFAIVNIVSGGLK